MIASNPAPTPLPNPVPSPRDNQPALEQKSAEEELSLRWRRAILRLSANLQTAAEQRSYLTPVLLEALNHALTQLLEQGNDYYIEELEEWLNYEDKSTYAGEDRRTGQERRSGLERRSAQDRRASGA